MSSPPNILFVRNCRGIYNLSGAEVQMLALFQALEHLGCGLRLVCTVDPAHGTTPWLEELRAAPIEHTEVPVSTAAGLADIRTALQLGRQHAPDLIHSFDHRSDLVGLLVARLTGAKAVASHFGWTNWNDEFARASLYESIDRFVISRMDGLIVDSAAILQTLKIKGGPEVSVIPNGLDTKRFSPDCAHTKVSPFDIDDPLVVGMLARFHPNKGQVELLEAIPSVLAERDDCRFIVAGSPLPGYESYLERMQATLKHLNLERYVCITEAQPTHPASSSDSLR